MAPADTLLARFHQPAACPRNFAVYYDPARARPGVMACAALPPAVRALHVRKSDLSFVFESRAAGVNATTLWDSGAAHSFVNAAFVRRHNLAVSGSAMPVELANGTIVQAPGSVRLKLRIQGLTTDLTLTVLDLTPGFDVILGDDWSRSHGVVADYGTYCDMADSCDLPPPPGTCTAHLYLRRNHLRLYPTAVSPPGAG